MPQAYPRDILAREKRHFYSVARSNRAWCPAKFKLDQRAQCALRPSHVVRRSCNINARTREMVNGMHNKSLEERLRLQAYHLWEADGRPEGRSTEYWEKARALLEQELASLTPPHETNEADKVAAKPAKKPVKTKSKATPADEDSVKTPKAKSKADAKVARKTATKTAAKPKIAGTDTAPKKPKTAAKSATKPKAIAEAGEKPAKKTAVKAAAKVSKTPKK